ncbi:hypothetical protein QSH24_17570 [Proteus faecis]|nr:hypothetical protein [Proteus faecis]
MKLTEDDNRTVLSSGSPYTTQVVSSGVILLLTPVGNTFLPGRCFSLFYLFYPMEKHHDQQKYGNI